MKSISLSKRVENFAVLSSSFGKFDDLPKQRSYSVMSACILAWNTSIGSGILLLRATRNSEDPHLLLLLFLKLNTLV